MCRSFHYYVITYQFVQAVSLVYLNYPGTIVIVNVDTVVASIVSYTLERVYLHVNQDGVGSLVMKVEKCAPSFFNLLKYFIAFLFSDQILCSMLPYSNI